MPTLPANNFNDKENLPREQNTIAVSAIQARLIRAQTADDDVKKEVKKADSWEVCKERVRVERSRLGTLKRKLEESDTVKATTSTSSQVPAAELIPSVSRNAVKSSKSLLLQVRLPVKPRSACKVVRIPGGVRTRIGKVREIDLNPNATKLVKSKNEAWERCKEQVRAEKAKLAEKLSK